MAKVKIEVEIPDYNIKYCDDVWYGGRCDYLETRDYGFKYYCTLSKKYITKIKNNGARVYRPYGCRCLAKDDQR
jgi:hypothetical protein